jgi:hypothetical protein
MSNHPDETWDSLKGLLPGLRRPALGGGLRRAEVGALLARIEDDVKRDVARAFEWDGDGGAWLTAAARSHRAGRFSTPSIEELEARVGRCGQRGQITFSVLLGGHALTDIGSLQAMAGPGTVFQVASQFNCLEAPGPTLARLADYVHDNTQGPRASVSAFPGTFMRHYAAPAPDGTRFTQTGARQLGLLADALAPEVAEVQGGYLMARGVQSPLALERALEAGFGRIRVGVHDGVDVVLGTNWGGHVEAGGHTIAQVFTSTMALGAYNGGAGDEFAGSCTWLLRAAYLGTFLAALDLGKRAVVLTLIGGGAFGNPLRSIWDAIVWAIDRANGLAPSDLTVVLNARDMASDVPRDEVADAVRARDGAIVIASSEGPA